MSDDALPPPSSSNGAGASQPDEGGSALFPSDTPRVPYIPPKDERGVRDRKRLLHRRKRYTLYVLRTHRRRQQERRSGRRRTILIAVCLFMTLIFGSLGTMAGAAYAYYQSMVPTLLSVPHQVLGTNSVRIFDEHNILLYQANYSGIKHSIPLTQIPVSAINATISIEDKDFFTNDGIDPQRIFAALIFDLQSRGNTSAQNLQGASTITQQLIKNTVLDSQQTLDRKIREAILSFGITEGKLYNSDWRQNKNEILSLYLNTIPYGPDIYGIDSAAYQYFGYEDNLQTGDTAAHHLDLAQASFLAGIPQNPGVFNPITSNGFKLALIRQQDVLQAMVKQHYITQGQADAATKEASAIGFIHPAQSAQYLNLAPHFVQFVIDELNSMIINGQINNDAAPGQLKAARSGLSVYTTLDLPLQDQVQQIMANHLFCNDIDDYGTQLFYDNVSETAAVLAQQSTGAVRVLLGSWDYYAAQTPTQCGYQAPHFVNGKYIPSVLSPNPYGKAVANQFDTARLGYRSAGSTFKAMVYSTAFEMGWFPAMTLDDVPTIFPGNYRPLDAEVLNYDGEMTIRHALQHSMDIPAIKTLDFIGVNNLLNTMNRVGITDYNGTPGLASAIGSLGVHLFDMVQAYATYGNYGRRVPLNGIDHILDGQGNLIYQYTAPRGIQVFSPQVSYLLTNVLSDNAARGGNHGFGVCSPLYLFTGNCYSGNPTLVFPAASKTGTTDNLADDWAMGYTMDYTGGVWVGNKDESDDMHDIDGITGAAPIWNKMMLAAELEKSTVGTGIDHQPQQFPVPQGVVRATYSSNNITTTDWFLANNVPTSQGTGNGGPTKVCAIITDPNTNAWDYCNAPPPPAPHPKPKP